MNKFRRVRRIVSVSVLFVRARCHQVLSYTEPYTEPTSRCLQGGHVAEQNKEILLGIISLFILLSEKAHAVLVYSVCIMSEHIQVQNVLSVLVIEPSVP